MILRHRSQRVLISDEAPWTPGVEAAFASVSGIVGEPHDVDVIPAPPMEANVLFTLCRDCQRPLEHPERRGPEHKMACGLWREA